MLFHILTITLHILQILYNIQDIFIKEIDHLQGLYLILSNLARQFCLFLCYEL